MIPSNEELQNLVAEMALLIQKNDEPDPQFYALFLQHPEFAFHLVDLIHAFEEDQIDEDPPVYSACIFALDICVAQLEAAAEGKNKVANKVLTQLMDHLADLINTHKHSLGFWLPILNAFYEVHVELSTKLKDAYLELANQDDVSYDESDTLAHLDSIKELIKELSDLSGFDIAENFFAQSYAMPPDFFADLVVDLYSIDEGQDIALLTLLHPKAEVREVVVQTIEQLINEVTFSSLSLSRLEVIKHWYPESFHPTFNKWIKIQRKKRVVFASEIAGPKNIVIRASEVDGLGSQGIFIHVKHKRKQRLCGLLLKYNIGIKDVWLTSAISAKEVDEYYAQVFDGTVTLRDVDLDYLQVMVEHFLAVSIERGTIPDLHLLEIQELLGLRFRPKKLDLDYIFESLSVQIVPFTQEIIAQSLKRSKSWFKNKKFTESWYLESPLIDKIVNHNSSYIDGVKVCRLEEAVEQVFAQEMEQHRDLWEFHFLWMALWAKVETKKREKIWQDSFLVAYCIREGKPLNSLPLMVEICNQTVINSVETMQERKTHLSKE